jgi:hypothetical protein
MNEKLLTQLIDQQAKALDILTQHPLSPTRRRLAERHLALNERIMSAIERPALQTVSAAPRDLLDVVDALQAQNHAAGLAVARDLGAGCTVDTPDSERFAAGLPDGYFAEHREAAANQQAREIAAEIEVEKATIPQQ